MVVVVVVVVIIIIFSVSLHCCWQKVLQVFSDQNLTSTFLHDFRPSFLCTASFINLQCKIRTIVKCKYAFK